MNRSQINDIILEAEQFIRSFGFRLPPFAYFTPGEMKSRRQEIGPIIDAHLGWDITDYGTGKFNEIGLVLFTTRNGSLEELKRGGGMCYAEKIMISRQDQVSPMHRHILKTEDIINRGGATLAIQMYESDAKGNVSEEIDVNVCCDGIARVMKPGDTLRLQPGESVTLRPGNWHAFWGDGGDVLIGEVSAVNDDLTDNIFRDPIGRFSDIVEDTQPIHLLVSDYKRVLS
jgi:hypothetical protein